MITHSTAGACKLQLCSDRFKALGSTNLTMSWNSIDLKLVKPTIEPSICRRRLKRRHLIVKETRLSNRTDMKQLKTRFLTIGACILAAVAR